MNRSEILRLAKNKMISGSRKYGKWDPKTDTRDLYQEMIDELIDCINYNIMQVTKIDLMRKKYDERGKKNL